MPINKILIILAIISFSVTHVYADTDDVNKQINHELSLLKKNPRDMQALTDLCTAYLNKADFNNALKWGERLQDLAYENRSYCKYVIHSHVIMGEAYTMKGDKMKAYNNLGQAEDNAKSAKNDSLMCYVCNAKAIYYVNMLNDTYSALNYLFRGLEAAKKSQHTKMYNILLSNIAETYYLRGDTTGLKFALECHERGSKANNDVLLFHSDISAAYLYYLKGQYSEAIRHLDECSSLMEKHEFHDRAQVFNIRGLIALKTKKPKEALKWFARSIEEKADGSVPCTACAYLGYGQALSALGHHSEAVDTLLRGVATATTAGSRRYMAELLLSISRCKELLGDKAEALRYYKMYHDCTDTIIKSEREFAIGDIKSKYDVAMKESQFKQQQIELMKSRNKLLVLAALLIITIITASLLYILYRRKNTLYKAIVQQNQWAIRREQTLKQQLDESHNPDKYASSSLSDNHKQALFARLEVLMDEEKPYRDHLLTKEKVAEMLSTNRTYLSQTINEQTGQTFTSYIGALRTKEAIRIISDPHNTTPLKAVCTEVGFSSMTTFYNQFQQTTGMTPATYRQKVIKKG